MKKFLSIILTVLLVGVLIFFISQFLGGGEGSDDGSGNGGNGNSVSDSTESGSLAEIEIKVSGKSYIFDDKEISLNEFVDKAKAQGDNSSVVIVDDDATKNAMDELKKSLDDNGVKYSVK